MKMLLVVAALAMVGLGAAVALAFFIDAFAHSRPAPAKAAAIVVLGARVDASGRATPALGRRVEKGAALYRERVAPLLIFSGGGVPSEASVSRDLARKLGVPAEACVLEERSSNTAENARHTARLLRERKIDAVVLVSDGYHLFRARRWFAAEGIRVQAVASERELSSTDRALRAFGEALAVIRSPYLLFR